MTRLSQETAWRARLWRRGAHEEVAKNTTQGPCARGVCLGPWRKISDTFPMKECRRCGQQS